MSDDIKIINLVDSVVMLTMSDWKTELRSNRYHYSTRWAKLLPVIFIQPHLSEEKYYFEDTEIENITILHVYQNFTAQLQSDLIAAALNEKGIISPLLWIYNPLLIDYIKQAYSPYKVYHATEDYFSPDYFNTSSPIQFISSLSSVIACVNEVICVSDGVAESIVNKNVKWKNKTRVIANGCDYNFYCNLGMKQSTYENNEPICFYQGNITNKIDFKMLHYIVKNMPAWKFQFCGRALTKSDDWSRILEYRNVEYLGLLTPSELRDCAHQATVGIIPFTMAGLVKSSLPLKAFEYVACGLPVVSTPIDALNRYNQIFFVCKHG